MNALIRINLVFSKLKDAYRNYMGGAGRNGPRKEKMRCLFTRLG